MALMLACAIASATALRSRIGPSRVLVVGCAFLGALSPLTATVDPPLVTLGLQAVAATILGPVVCFHPARSTLLPSRPANVEYVPPGLTVAIALPVRWLTLDYQWMRLTVTDEVAERWVDGGLSMYLLLAVALATVTSVSGRVRRFTGIAAAFLAGALALVSIAYPTELHGLDTVGGLLLGWALVFAIVTIRLEEGANDDRRSTKTRPSRRGGVLAVRDLRLSRR